MQTQKKNILRFIKLWLDTVNPPSPQAAIESLQQLNLDELNLLDFNNGAEELATEEELLDYIKEAIVDEIRAIRFSEKRDQLIRAGRYLSYNKDGIITYLPQDNDGSMANYEFDVNLKFFDKNQEKIVCRHLAWQFLNERHKPEKHDRKQYHHTFERPDAIEDLRNNVYDNLRVNSRAQTVEFFYLNDLNDKIKAHLKNLPSGSVKYCLMHSENHAMAIILKKRHDGMSVVNFYDPNHTIAHKRTLVTNAMLDQREFPLFIQLSDNEIKTYFPSSRVCSLGDYGDDLKLIEEGELPNFIVNEDQENPLDFLYAYLSLGYAEGVEAIMNQILFVEPKYKWNRLLAAKRKDHCPGLLAALVSGNAQAIGVYIERVLACDLSNHDKCKLLFAGSGDSSPGLSVPLQLGFTETVRIYLNLVLNSDLDTNQKYQLAAITHHRISGLSMAIQYNHGETITAYVNEVVNANIDHDLKCRILIGEFHGEPGLLLAFANGCTDALVAYMNGILKSNLDDERKYTLLAVKNNDGLFGLEIAVQNGYVNTLAAYADAILDSDLDPAIKQQLLDVIAMKEANKLAEDVIREDELPFAEGIQQKELDNLDRINQDIRHPDVVIPDLRRAEPEVNHGVFVVPDVVDVVEVGQEEQNLCERLSDLIPLDEINSEANHEEITFRIISHINHCHNIRHIFELIAAIGIGNGNAPGNDNKLSKLRFRNSAYRETNDSERIAKAAITELEVIIAQKEHEVSFETMRALIELFMSQIARKDDVRYRKSQFQWLTTLTIMDLPVDYRDYYLDVELDDQNQHESIAILIAHALRSFQTVEQIKNLFDAIGIGRSDNAGDHDQLAKLRYRKLRSYAILSRMGYRETDDSYLIAKAGFERARELLEAQGQKVASKNEYDQYVELFDCQIERGRPNDRGMLDWFTHAVKQDYRQAVLV